MAFSSKGDKANTPADAPHFCGFFPRRYVSEFSPRLVSVHFSPFHSRASNPLWSARPLAVQDLQLRRHHYAFFITLLFLPSYYWRTRDGSYSTSSSFIPLLGSKLTPEKCFHDRPRGCIASFQGRTHPSVSTRRGGRVRYTTASASR
jgi:hypothetical protein